MIIAGFPFLTQVAARRLNKVVIRAAGKKLGPVEVRHLDLTLHGIRGSAETASQLSGTALVGFAGLAGMIAGRRDDWDAGAHAGRRRP